MSRISLNTVDGAFSGKSLLIPSMFEDFARRHHWVYIGQTACTPDIRVSGIYNHIPYRKSEAVYASFDALYSWYNRLTEEARSEVDQSVQKCKNVW